MSSPHDQRLHPIAPATYWPPASTCWTVAMEASALWAASNTAGGLEVNLEDCVTATPTCVPITPKGHGGLTPVGPGRPKFPLRALRLARPPKRAYAGLPVAVRLPSGSGDAADRRLAGAARREPARVAEVCARYPVLFDRQMRAGRSVSASNSSPCCRRSFVVSGRGLMSHFSSWSLALRRSARPERTASPPRS